MKVLRPILASVLVLLVLVSSTSFIVGLHYCMGEVQHVALFTKAGGCEREQMLPPCHKHMQAPCCDDETILHEGTDFKISSESFEPATPDFIEVTPPLVLISEVIPSAAVSRFSYYDYDPPLRSSDRVVSLQVFLI